MPLESWRTRLVHLDVGLGEEFLGALAIEARMHAGDEIEGLRNLEPARQHGHVGDEAHLVHQRVALGARIVARAPSARRRKT